MADAARTDFDQDILVINPWAFQLFDSQWLASLEHSSFHHSSYFKTTDSKTLMAFFAPRYAHCATRGIGLDRLS